MSALQRLPASLFARHAAQAASARPRHRSHGRRLMLEPLEVRALLSATTWTVNSLGDTGAGSGTVGRPALRHHPGRQDPRE